MNLNYQMGHTQHEIFKFILSILKSETKLLGSTESKITKDNH